MKHYNISNVTSGGTTWVLIEIIGESVISWGCNEAELALQANGEFELRREDVVINFRRENVLTPLQPDDGALLSALSEILFCCTC